RSITLNIAVFAPIPSASVTAAMIVKPGFLQNIRTPNRKSRQHVSTKNSQPPERTSSFVTSRLPRSRRTSRSASLRLTPCFIFSAASISKRSEEHTSELQSLRHLVCRLLLEKKKQKVGKMVR